MVMMVAQSLICSPCFTSVNQSNIRKKNKKIPGNNPGYIRKESDRCPCNKKEMDRWIPHPGQSIPVNCLLIHGSIQLSVMSTVIVLVRNAYFDSSFFIISCSYSCNVNSA